MRWISLFAFWNTSPPFPCLITSKQLIKLVQSTEKPFPLNPYEPFGSGIAFIVENELSMQNDDNKE